MQKEGFKLTAEDIYDINKASLKDLVLLFIIYVMISSENVSKLRTVVEPVVP